MCNTCTTCNCDKDMILTYRAPGFNITKPGEYKLRNGAKAIVLGFRKDNGRAIGYAVSVIKQGSVSWNSLTGEDGNGNYHNGLMIPYNSEYDIVDEWKEPSTKEIWINIYNGCAVGSQTSKIEALSVAGSDVLGTVGIRFTEGGGAEIITD